ncbi:MAG TPA: dihydrodipicolinate synthase family protein, partial [Pirellulaceae bacterium]|nr:dihydrodipicolinate synthase family protein [Pirellulaceae bacterium]
RINAMKLELHGLVAATHTPFTTDGELNLAVVEQQAEHLQRQRVATVFIGGTTGESHSLTLAERLALAQRWSDVCRGSTLRLVIHVGSNCLADARTLAAQAEALQAAAISALAPSYFKPKNVDTLVACCAEIAGAAPSVPFYFYDIPSMTGVQMSMPDFLETARQRIPSLAGIKFTNADLMAFQRTQRAQAAAYDILWGVDEYLLAALALGARGAVGSSYNFAAPIYHRVIAAFAQNDLATARDEQFRSVQLIELLASYGYMAAAKATMGFLGVEVGPPRLPNARLAPADIETLRGRLEQLGFFPWVQA